MDTTQTIQLVKSDRELIVDLIATGVAVLVLYVAMNPHALDAARLVARRRWQGFLYRVSVWNARQAIRSLPETD